MNSESGRRPQPQREKSKAILLRLTPAMHQLVVEAVQRHNVGRVADGEQPVSITEFVTAALGVSIAKQQG